ncbi:MAG: hypothetical protein QOC82_90 [Frankiaceae bacterium]|jgi:hypothetical protein|nr:hypothetical protein [Frankiaceae bacterium]
MTLATLAYDPARAHDVATVVAGVVPVVLVAAFAVPVRRVQDAKDAPAALTELLAVSVMLAFALLTEMLALYGIAYGLGRVDQGLLFFLLLLTAVAALRRMIAPLVQTYAEDRGIPQARLWAIFFYVTLVLVVGFTFLLAYVEQG